MRKTAEKSTAASLGTKRSCPQCGTKFYDFNKEDLVCPKCDAKVDPDSTKTFKPPPEPKKPKKEGPEAALLESEDIVVGGDEAFESVEDLEDEDEELVDDMNNEEGGDF